MLEKLYTRSANQSKELGIINFKGKLLAYLKLKRKIRRQDKAILKNVKDTM